MRFFTFKNFILCCLLLTGTHFHAHADHSSSSPDLDKASLHFQRKVEGIDETVKLIINLAKSSDKQTAKLWLSTFEKLVIKYQADESTPTLSWYTAGQLLLLHKIFETKLATTPEKMEEIATNLLKKYFDVERCQSVLDASIFLRSLQEFANIAPDTVYVFLFQLKIKLNSFENSEIKKVTLFQADSLIVFASIISRYKILPSEARGVPIVLKDSDLRTEISKIQPLLQQMQTEKSEFSRETLKDTFDLLQGLKLYLYRLKKADPSSWLEQIKDGLDDLVGIPYTKEAIAHALTLFTRHEILYPSRQDWYATTQWFVKNHLPENGRFKFRTLLMYQLVKSTTETIRVRLTEHALPLAILDHEKTIAATFPLFHSAYYQVGLVTTDFNTFRISFKEYFDLYKESMSDNTGEIRARLKDVTFVNRLVNLRAMKTWLEIQCYSARATGGFSKVIFPLDLAEKEIELSQVCKQPFNTQPNISSGVENYMSERVADVYWVQGVSDTMSNPIFNALFMLVTSRIANGMTAASARVLAPKMAQTVAKMNAYFIARSSYISSLVEAETKLTWQRFSAGLKAEMALVQNSPQFIAKMNQVFQGKVYTRFSNVIFSGFLSSIYFTGVHRALSTSLSLGAIPLYDYKKSLWQNFASEIIWGAAIFTAAPWLGEKAKSAVRNSRNFAKLSPRRQDINQILGHGLSDTVVFASVPYVHRVFDKYIAPKKPGEEADPVWQGYADLSDHLLSSGVLSVSFRAQDYFMGVELNYGKNKKAVLMPEPPPPDEFQLTEEP